MRRGASSRTHPPHLWTAVIAFQNILGKVFFRSNLCIWHYLGSDGISSIAICDLLDQLSDKKTA